LSSPSHELQDVVITKALRPHNRPSWSEIGAAGVFTVEAGGTFPRHYHDAPEYWLVFKGRGVIEVGDQSYWVGPGDIVCTPAGVEHDVVGVVETLEAFFVELEVPPGGRDGKLTLSGAPPEPHDVPLVEEGQPERS